MSLYNRGLDKHRQLLIGADAPKPDRTAAMIGIGATLLLCYGIYRIDKGGRPSKYRGPDMTGIPHRLRP